MKPSFINSPWVLRDASQNRTFFIACVNLGFCSLPPRHQQYEKTVVVISGPELIPVAAGNTSQQYFLITPLNLGNIYAMPLNSLSYLGMPVRTEVGEVAVQFDGSPKAALTKSSPYPPAFCPAIRVIPLYVGQHTMLTWRGREPIVQRT